ncbi:hypothetical protein D3C75_186850 [compost metagenome]
MIKIIISKVIGIRRRHMTQDQLDKIEKNKEVRVKVIDKIVMFTITILLGVVMIIKIVKLFM